MINPNEFAIPDPETLAMRQQVAREFASHFGVSTQVLVDSMDDEVGKAYHAAPDRIYVIDAEGRVAYSGPKGPAGFKVSDVPHVLDELLHVSRAGQLNGLLNDPSSGQLFPPDMQPPSAGVNP